MKAGKIPSKDVLPRSLAKLARRNAIDISDSRWQFDVERLIEALEEALSKEPAPSRPPPPAGNGP